MIGPTNFDVYGPSIFIDCFKESTFNILQQYVFRRVSFVVNCLYILIHKSIKETLVYY